MKISATYNLYSSIQECQNNNTHPHDSDIFIISEKLEDLKIIKRTRNKQFLTIRSPHTELCKHPRTAF